MPNSNRRFVLKSLVAAMSSALALSAVRATPGITPVVSFLLDGTPPPEPPNSGWFDEVGLLPVTTFQAMISSEALNRSVEIWVDAQRAPTGNEDGSFDNPFNNLSFLGGRNLASLNWTRSSIPIVPDETVIRLKGSFKRSDHVAGSHSTHLQIRYDGMSNGSGGYNIFTGEPLIFAPWPDGSSYHFDAQGQSYPYIPNKVGESCPIFLLGSDDKYVDVVFYGLEVFNSGAPLAVHAFEGTRTLRMTNCHIHDNSPPSDALYGNGGVGVHASKVNGSYVIDHCKFASNAGTVDNNVGDINFKSAVGTDVELNKLLIKNSEFLEGVIAVTGKHSGNSTVEAFNNYFTNYESVFYARGNVWSFHHNIIHTIAHSVAYPDYQNFNNAASIIFDHNTCVNCQRPLESTYDGPGDPATGAISWSFTNNVFIDSYFSGRSFHGQAVYSDGSQVPTTFQHSYNLYGFLDGAKSVFYEFDQGSGTETRTFTQAMLELNDTSSRFAAPEINLATFEPLPGGNCDGAGQGGSNIGAL